MKKGHSAHSICEVENEKLCKLVRNLSQVMRSLYDAQRFSDLEMVVEIISRVCFAFSNALDKIAMGGSQGDGFIEILKVLDDENGNNGARG